MKGRYINWLISRELQIKTSPLPYRFKKIILLFWLYWAFTAACGLSLVETSRGYSSLRCAGFSLQRTLLWGIIGSWHTGFSICGAQDLALQHVESSQTRDWTHVPCTGKQILIYCTTREFPVLQIFKFKKIDINCWQRYEEICALIYWELLLEIFSLLVSNTVLSIKTCIPFNPVILLFITYPIETLAYIHKK